MSTPSTTLYLIPTFLGEGQPVEAIPAQNIEIIKRLQYFIVENEKSARAFLKRCGVLPPYDHIQLFRLDKHSSKDELISLIKELTGKEVGLFSDAGCPAVADPGADFVRMAHVAGWKVRPLTGSSSILLALMASGLNGQGFTFHGYLPVNGHERQERLKEIESTAEQTGYTQLFMETPFRNDDILADILRHCKQQTWLSVACDIGLPGEEIYSKPMSEWKKFAIQLRNRPAVFSIWVESKKGHKPKYTR